MKTCRMRYVARVVVAAYVSLASATAAQVTDNSRDSLAGIGPIKVLVENIPADIEPTGLTMETLRTAVELRLRQNSVPLADEADPYLYIDVTALRSSNFVGYVYGVNVELRQPVQIVHPADFRISALERLNAEVRRRENAQTALPVSDARIATGLIVFDASTWNVRSIGAAPLNELRSIVRDYVLDYVDRFINDYLAVNPR